MNARWSAVLSGLAWIVFSPLALLMALIAKTESLTVYYMHVAAFGAWTAAGVLSGVGTIASATWTRRLKAILCWVAFGYFGVGGVAIAGYAVLLPGDRATLAMGFAVATMVVATGLPFLFLARQQGRPSTDR